MPLSPLFRNYEHVLLDLDGCVWVDQTPTPNAREALADLRNHGKTARLRHQRQPPGARGVRAQAVVHGSAGVAGGDRHRRLGHPVRAGRSPPGHADLRHRLGGDLPPRERRRSAHRQRHRPRRQRRARSGGGPRRVHVRRAPHRHSGRAQRRRDDRRRARSHLPGQRRLLAGDGRRSWPRWSTPPSAPPAASASPTCCCSRPRWTGSGRAGR